MPSTRRQINPGLTIDVEEMNVAAPSIHHRARDLAETVDAVRTAFFATFSPFRGSIAAGIVPILLVLAVALPFALPFEALGQSRVVDLGVCPLASGEVIQNCEIAYETFGTLNADGSNAILFPSWFRGTTQNQAGLVGPGRLVDTTKYFVIAVGAFGDGISSSPSRVREGTFPEFTIGDMVEAQHRFLVDILGIDRLRAVVGISMGGMQAYEWLVRYPGFAEAAVPIVGSPQLASYDLLVWETMRRIVEKCEAVECANPSLYFRLINSLVVGTPEDFSTGTPREEFWDFVARLEQGDRSTFRAGDTVSQLQAMLAFDVAERFGGSLERAAESIEGRLLTVVATHDHMVTPGPARVFNDLVGGTLLELDTPCGHRAFSCETARIGEVIDAFLAAGD